MDAKRFSRVQIFRHQLTREFEPRRTLTAEVLQQETLAAKDASAERLLKADADLSWMALLIHESSPASEMTASFESSVNSRT